MKTIYDFMKNGTEEQSSVVLGIIELAREEKKIEERIEGLRADYERQTELYESGNRLNRVRNIMTSALILARILGMECPEVILNYQQYIGESITIER